MTNNVFNVCQFDNCINMIMSRYDKRIKPPGAGSLRVNISVVLLSLSSPDESSLVKLVYSV